jgi:hypothetical protein
VAKWAQGTCQTDGQSTSWLRSNTGSTAKCAINMNYLIQLIKLRHILPPQGSRRPVPPALVLA